MEYLLELDRKLFLFFNGLHADWLDPVVFYMTKLWFWLPLYALLFIIVLRHYRKQSWIILLSIIMLLLLTDQITSTLMKPFFARLRPSHEPLLEGLVHTVKDYKGGLYGFASGHAANTFGIATFFFLLLRKTNPWIKWIFLWAIVMTYTRIYLGVHYPGDVLVGGMVGMMGGWVVVKVMRRVTVRYFNFKF